ncbi:MAG: 3-oxoacyl-ACP reductase family protein [Patescibacteria group bacterium]
MPNFKDKIAIITGGSRGIGRACALELAKAGVKAGLNYHQSQKEAQELVDLIQQSGGEAIAIQADVSQKQDCQKLVDQTLEKFGRIDILVNNAGKHTESLIDKIDETSWNQMMDTNAKSIYMMSVLAGKVMKKRGSGVIINIGSVAGMFPRNTNTAYAVSKGAVWTLTRALAIALAPQVRVNAVAPGRIETDMSPMDSPQRRQLVSQENLRQRIGQPKDIARVVAFLASDEADWITGQTIVADGGSSLI